MSHREIPAPLRHSKCPLSSVGSEGLRHSISVLFTCVTAQVHAGVGGLAFHLYMGTGAKLRSPGLVAVPLPTEPFSGPLYLECLRPGRKPMTEVMPHFGSSGTVNTPEFTGIQQGLFQTFKQWGPELKSGMGGVVWAKGLDYSGAKGS